MRTRLTWNTKSSIALILVLLLGLSAVASAQDANPGYAPLVLKDTAINAVSGPGTTGIQVANLVGQSNAIDATYYATDGTPYALPQQTLAAKGDSYTYYNEPAQATFEGAAILSGGQPFAGIVNKIFPDNNAGAAYEMTPEYMAATSVLAPLVVKENYGISSVIAVQNTDTSSSVVAEVTFTPQAATNHSGTMTDTIQPGSSWIIDLGADANFEASWLGSATVAPADGTTPLVVAVMNYSDGFFYAYSGLTSVGQLYSLPLVRANFGFATTGVQVVAATSDDTTVTISYKGAAYNSDYTVAVADYTCDVQATLPGGSSITFYNAPDWGFADVLGASAAAITGGTCQTNNDTQFGDAGDLFLGSATVTANFDVAVVVNDQIGTTSSGAYGGFLTATGGGTPGSLSLGGVGAGSALISPLARTNFYGITSGTQVQNICNVPVTVTAEYKASPASLNPTPPTVDPVTIAAGSSHTFYVAPGGTADGFLGSLTVSTSGADPCLVGITNDAPGVNDASVFGIFPLQP